MNGEPCAVCGQPCYNCDRHGDPTGKHLDLEECLRAMGARIAVLEKRGERHHERDHGHASAPGTKEAS